MAISSQHLAVLTSHESGALVEVWRSNQARGVLDEAAIVAPSWLPTTGAGWTDVSAQVLLSEGVEVAHDGRGHTISLTIAAESRLEWLDDLAVAIVAQAWDGSAYTARAVVAWGYLAGDGSQQLDADGNQSGKRTAQYAGYWERTRVPAHRLGRANLADGATVAGSTPALASVTAEAPGEYLSQDDNAPAKAIDQDADTVYIGDIIADPTQPTIGDDDNVHILRAYAGRTTRSIGAGNEPVWIELAYVHQVATWGTMTSSGAVPNLYDSSSNLRNDSQIISSIPTVAPFGSYYQIRARTGQADPTVRNGVQWNLGLGAAGRPLKMVMEYRAPDPASEGRQMYVTLKDLSPDAGSGEQRLLRMAGTWQEAEFDIAAVSNYGGVVLRVQNGRGEVATADLYMAFRFKFYLGYSDKGYAETHDFKKLHLSWDDGAGGVGTQRIAWDLSNNTDDWVIPPLGTVIICDDAATFRAKFDPGDRQVYQMRNLNPSWFFGPGVGKLALRYGQVAPFNTYAPATGFDTIEEINFVTNGLTWLPYQGVSRQSPIGTGALAVEDYPHVGLLPGSYGGGFLWLDLGAYQSARLALPMTSGQTTMQVDDGDRLVPGGEAVIGTERLLLGARTQNSFAVTRAYGGTTAAAHNPDVAVTPRLAGATQTGPQWDTIELRRKPGTPAIRSGVVIASNLASPGDPSTGGSKWERHPDWTLIARFDNQAQADVISLAVPGGVIQARHVCVGDVLMHRRAGVAQRWKLNELVVREVLPGQSSAGGWVGHAAADMAEAAAHFLTQHGGLPASKLAVTATPAPMGDLPVAASTLAQILGNLAGDAGLVVWLDPYNAATIAPDPSNPQYDAREAYVTLDSSMLLNPPAGDWAVARPVAQVKGTFRETASLRTYVIAYPDIPGTLGEVAEVRGTVRSWSDGRDRAEREYRVRNTRRTPQRVTVGPAPWARPYMRVVYTSAELDAGGQFSGVNCVLTAYRHKFSVDDAGAVQWECDLSLSESVL